MLEGLVDELGVVSGWMGGGRRGERSRVCVWACVYVCVWHLEHAEDTLQRIPHLRHGGIVRVYVCLTRYVMFRFTVLHATLTRTSWKTKFTKLSSALVCACAHTCVCVSMSETKRVCVCTSSFWPAARRMKYPRRLVTNAATRNNVTATRHLDVCLCV